ncbi:MAG: N-acetyltransferase family protein [Halococcoides sp.]
MADERCSIRRYRPDDADRIFELHERALRADDAYCPEAPDDDLRDPIGAYVDSGGDFLVGTVADRIVAMGAYRPAPEWAIESVPGLPEPAAQLKRMRVDPDDQRRGFGTEILDALEDRAREDGYRSLVLDTGAHQDGTRAFYEAQEFAHERTLMVDFDGIDLRMALYRKRLDG